MNIKLMKLGMENFKGIKKQEISFTEVTNIYGANASGKTTVADAFSWLLFNKDSHGSEKFDLRPLDETGNRIDNVEISVTGVLEIDGLELTLYKMQKQNWVKKRGTEVVELQGNPNSYEVNGIPKSETEYKRLIDDYIQEALFKMITNPKVFSELPWKKQRETLLRLVTDIDDGEVAGSDARFLSLVPQLESFSVEDLTAKALKALKEWKRKQAELPSRIDEVSKSIMEIDIAVQESKRDTLLVQMKSIEKSQEEASGRFRDIENIDNQMMGLSNKAQELQRQANGILESRRASILDKKAKAEIAFRQAMSRHSFLMEEIDKKSNLMKTASRDVEILREKYKELYAKEICSNDIQCPVCKQAYPVDKREELVKEFHSNKQERLLDIQRDGQNTSKSIVDLQSEIRILKEEVEEVKRQKIAANKEQDDLEKELSSVPLKADISGNEEYVALMKDMAELQEALSLMDTGADYRKQLKDKAATLREELLEVEKILSSAQSNVRAKKRIDELTEEQRKVSQKVADQEKELFLLEEFTRSKMNLLSTKINKRFHIVKWKLFERQMNGGMKEACECMLNGVPYGALNSAGKIQAGIDIINSLSELYDVSAPIFIDNREGCTEIPDVTAQVINLYVSENDSKLRVEVE